MTQTDIILNDTRNNIYEGLSATLLFSEIDVLRKKALNDFKWVIYIRIRKLRNDYDRIDSVASFKYATWIYNHAALFNTFWQKMLAGCSIRVETLANFEAKSRLPRQN